MKKEMLINVLQPEECRIAIVEDGILEELYVERTSHENYTGNIYKGRIVNIEPAIQAAFVDFSVGRNGFLHVSDVEPQYYRHAVSSEPEPPPRERRRPLREEVGGQGAVPPSRDPLRPTDDEHALFPEADLPPQLENLSSDLDDAWDGGRPWGPDLDRPDLSEKGRRDRSERHFGEGLIEGWDEPPPRARRTPVPPPDSNLSRASIATTPSRTEPVELPIASRSTPIDQTQPPMPIEAELPPSRTRRGREPRRVEHEGPESPAPEEIGGWNRERTSKSIGDDPRTQVSGNAARPEPSNLRPPRPATPQIPEAPRVVERPVEPDIRFDAELEELEDHPRRRGRDAIRARGGERKPPRARPPARPRPVEDRERRPGDEPAPPAAPQSEGPGWGRRQHARAGEPGYVPRRERSLPPESIAAPRPDASQGWSEATGAASRPESAGTPEFGGPITPGSVDDDANLENRRRRRRRRRRTPERGTPSSPASERARPAGRDGLDEFLDDAEAGYTTPRPVYSSSRPIIDDLDDTDSRLSDEDDLGLDDSSVFLDAEPRPIEEIDPELEEEIRREIEEIQVLEREMGLRATTEARPRRGDDAAAVARGEGPRGRGQFKPPIQEIFRRGDEVLIQVIKESIGTKGPTLSTYISIPGRYLVLMPGLNRFGVSRKIADEAQRRRLRDIMHSLNPPKGLGFIVRTAGIDRTKSELARDLAYLLRLWKVILRRIKKAKAPSPIYQESDMIIRTIRDIFTGEIDTIWIDERSAYERAHEFMKVVMPKFVDRVRFYDDRVPLFHRYGLEEEITRIQRRRVDLVGGGSIVIDQTEALVAIDVNSGNFRVEDDAERTAFEMNLRAAKEIARQLRLRDLGGVIVNDFIDMREERHRRGVERALREAVRRDRARTKVLRMSQFGIIEMTRQRIRPSLKRSVYEDCGHCNGAGVAKTAESMAIDVMRLLALAAHRADVRRINVTVAGPVAGYLNNRKRREIARIEVESNLLVSVRHLESAPAEHLQVDCFDAANNEVRLLAAPAAPTRRGRY
jgi:ribonuclease E